MTRGVRLSPEHPPANTTPSTNREKGEGRRLLRRRAPSRSPSRTSPFSPLPPLRNIRPSESQEVGKKPVRPRHPRRQLAETAEPRVHVRAAAQRGHEETALERRAARIVRLELRHVGRVPVVREREPALLYPALPIVGADLVRPVEQDTRGIENRHWGRLVGDPVVWLRDREPERREVPLDERIL